MTFDQWTELFALLGSFIASAFALVRVSLNQHRGIVDQFVSFIDAAVKRQEAANDRFHTTLERLTDTVQENSAVLSRMAERM